MVSHAAKSSLFPQNQQTPYPSACDTRPAFLVVEFIGMPYEVAIMLCPYRDSTPEIRRAKARIIERAYRNTYKERIDAK